MDDEIYDHVDVEEFKFCIYKNDTVIGNHLRAGKFWEKDICEKIVTYIKPHTKFIDIGAHIGTHTVYAGRHTDSEIHSFEPIVSNFNLLNKNIKLNNIKNCIVYNVGLTSPNLVRQKFYEPQEFGDLTQPTNFGGFGLTRTPTGSQAQMKTLDIFNFANVSVIKIDVEGHEIEVLNGAIHTIKQNKPVIFIEVWPHLYSMFTKSAAYELLVNDLAYNIVKIGNMDFIFIPSTT